MLFGTLIQWLIFGITPLLTASKLNGRIHFLNDWLSQFDQTSIVVSHLELTKKESVILCKSITINTRQCQINVKQIKPNDHSIHLVDLKQKNALQLLQDAKKEKVLTCPARWVLFFDANASEVNINVQNKDYLNEMTQIEVLLQNIYLAINTEVYVAFQSFKEIRLFSVYKIKPHLPLVWEENGSWTSRRIVNKYLLTDEVLAIRRRDLQGADVVAVSVILNNRTFVDMPDYLHREMDTLTKLVYYITIHLFEWVNGTGIINRTDSWGYKQADGRYNGIVREMEDGRADFSGSLMIPTKERKRVANFVLTPSPVEAIFIFKKPALASVTNIYALPFSTAVWLSTMSLIIILSATLFLVYFREEQLNSRYKMTVLQKISEGFHETMCLVFQQGTAFDPVSVACRQILLLGLMAFMFLYTAYSANIVALLQSATNDINSIETLLTSPLECGAQDVVYNRQMFQHETRPIHRALSVQKILPQGEKAFLSSEEGIRKVRQGLYAFHVEQTAGYDQIQRTFLEDEKCNLGAIKYMSLTYPYFAITDTSHIKEQLRIGVTRIKESGVQERTTRRMLPRQPQCGAGAAVFAAVRLLDVAPAFRCLLALYALTLPVLALEILTHRHEIRKRKFQKDDEQIIANNND